MQESPPTKLSVSLALDALSDAAEEVRRLEVALEEARARRDDLLIDAYESVSITKLARIVKLSRERVSRIASGKTRGV